MMNVKSNVDQNRPLKDADQKAEYSRRQFLTRLGTGGGAFLLGAWGALATPASLAPGLPKALPTPPGEPPPFEGYSIFHETMVELPWPEIKQAAQEEAIVLLPIGVIEEHGPHMGLGADVYLSYLWSKLTRRALEAQGIKALIAPPYYWGISLSTAAFPGSFSVRDETMQAVLYDIHASLHQWGFRYVFSFNLHGDPTHNRVLRAALEKVRTELEMGAYVVTAHPSFLAGWAQIKQEDIHAGAFETAEMATSFPQEVNLELAKTLPPTDSFEPLGYFGDPAKFEVFNTEEIKQWEEAFSVTTADWIKVILNLDKAKH
jgi:creatinine amidohydrolase